MCCEDSAITTARVRIDTKTVMTRKPATRIFDTLRIQKPLKIGDAITVEYAGTDNHGIVEAFTTYGCLEVCDTEAGLTDKVVLAPLPAVYFWEHLTKLQKRFLETANIYCVSSVESLLYLPSKIPHVSCIPHICEAKTGALPSICRQMLMVASIDDAATLRNMIRLDRLKFDNLPLMKVVLLLVRLCLIQLRRYSNPSVVQDIKVWNDTSRPRYERAAARVSAAEKQVILQWLFVIWKSYPKTKPDVLPAGYANLCAMCGRGYRLLLCSRCRAVRYCSKRCQRSNWRSHKARCSTKVPV